MEKAFFIDKDGTLTDYHGYSNPPLASEVLYDRVLFDEVVDGLKHIQSKGYKLILISNQPFVSTGIVTKEQMDNLFNNLINSLKERGVSIDDFYYCPHGKNEGCFCRKPEPGMIIQAAEKHGIDLSQSFMVGDDKKDVLAGKNAGTKTVLVLTGVDRENSARINADHIVDNVNSLMEVI